MSSSPARRVAYAPRDQLYLWWLAEPARPVWVGELNMVRALRGVSLRYADTWIEHGFPLSEDLPLLPGHEFLPQDRDTAAGAVDDARPDRWGERVIRLLDKPPRLSLLEYLYFAGDEPRRLGPLANEPVAFLIDNTDDHEKNHAVLVNDSVEYELSPAYDVLPSGQALGYQQMRVGESAGDSTLSNALSMCGQFALKPAEARQEARTVVAAVAAWRQHFAAAGVSASDIEMLGEHIDRPFLREQRDDFAP